MATRTGSVAVAVFDDVSDAQQAVRDLHTAGFTDDEIGFVTHDKETRRTEGTGTLEESKTGEGAAAGAAIGAGGGALWTLGVAAGVLPAIGPVIAGGILAAMLGSAAGGAAVGGIAGALIGAGMSEDEAHRYEKEFRSGRTLVSVADPKRYDEALTILVRNGGDTSV